jgi:cobalt/nickel transport system permease protein
MKISDLDYYATFGNTFLHKIPAKYKLLDAAIILIAVFYAKNAYSLAIMYFLLMTYLVFSGLPRLKFFKASLYPLIFTVIFLYSIENLTYLTAFKLILRVLCISTTFIFLVFTTPYIQIFKELSGFLPDIMVNILFNTYRSLFIINKTLDNLLTTVRLRGKLSITRPINSLKTIGNLVGFFVIKSIETSEKMYDGIKLRGYSDNFLFLRK